MAQDYELFDKAADIIEHEGHSKIEYRDRRGYCLVGAVWEAVDRASCLTVVERAIRRQELRAKLGERLGMDMPEFWNDRPWRRKGTVVKLLREMAREEETVFLRDQVSRLTVEKVMLEARVRELESKNRWLQRRLLRHELDMSRKNLAGIEAQLAGIESKAEVLQ